MKLSHHDEQERTVLTVQGELASDKVDQFRRATLERFDARVRDFVIELGDCDGIDSQGLESWVWLQEQCEERLGQVRLAGCPDYLRDILRMTRLDARLQCCVDTESAIQSLN